MALSRQRQLIRRQRRSLFLESLEHRQLLAAAVAANVVDYSQSRVIVRFDSAQQPTDVVGSMLHNGVVLSESGNVYRFDLQTGYEMQQVISALTSATGVIFAQPDNRMTASATPNDPSYSQVWGLNSTSDADIDAPEAWNTQRGSSSTLVAIIDTGIDYNHPDLAANIWTNPGEIAGNGHDDDGNGYVDDIHGYDFANNDGNPMDDNMHGTHVAGTIGAVGNNGVGVVGVSWNVKMMALKFLDADGSGYDSDAIRAIDYAVRMGAKISNNSWGGGGYNTALADAIARARAAGHIIVAAAGNEGANNDTSPNFPSNYNYNNVIAVAATGATDQLASWSNYGATTVDLAAPGVNILSTLPGNRYGRLSGTSMATPHVTGVVALVMSQFPQYTYRQVIDKVISSVDRLPQLNGRVITGGRLNAAKAVSTGTTTPPVTTPPVTTPPVTTPPVTTPPVTTPPVTAPPAVTPPAVGGAVSFGSTQQMIIGDRQTITSTINVTGDVRIADLNVMLNIKHTYDSDLRITLRSPSGKTITLVNRRGGSGNNFGGTILDDEATRSISAGPAPFSGAFRPESALSAFDNLLSKGVWTLTITDVARLDSGTLLGWSLTFTSAGSVASRGEIGTTTFAESPTNIDSSTGDRVYATVHTFAFRDDPNPAQIQLAAVATSSLDRVMAELSQRENLAVHRLLIRR